MAYISIIVPVYRAEATLRRCVDSVLKQDCSDFELLLINDGSPDLSLAICREYEASDSRVRVLDKQNGGVSSARNLGIDNAIGEYIFLLDSDDELAENALSEYVRLSEDGAFDLVAGTLSVVTDGIETSVIGYTDDRDYGKDIFEDILLYPQKFGYAGGKMLKRATVSDLRFDISMTSQEDTSFLLDFYRRAERLRFSSFKGYIYYYQPSKRDPVLTALFGNRIKALRYAYEVTVPTGNAVNAVKERILSDVFLLFSYSSDISAMLAELKSIEGLESCLDTYRSKGEREKIRKLFLKNKSSSIRRHFALRKKLRSLLKRG